MRNQFMRNPMFILLMLIMTLSTISPVFADTCELRTHTQEDWGTSSRNDNPASYRTKHFASAFPNGARIGLEEHNSALFTSSLKIQTYLPSEGDASPLGGNTIDTTNPVGGLLGGETLALLLNVAFDLENESFAPSTSKLRDAVVQEGPCVGMPISQLLMEGNAILAGLPSTHAAEKIALCMKNVNENSSVLSCGNTTFPKETPNNSQNQSENISGNSGENNSGNNNVSDSPETSEESAPPSATLRIGKWYPKGTHYVFHCDTNNTSPTNYSWHFGDGEKLLQIKNQNVYHVYKKPGTYTLSCTAHSVESAISTEMSVIVVAG